MAHTVFHGPKFESWVVFNDQPLSFESISDADIQPIAVKPGSGCASKAWSCNAIWYFVIRHNDIIVVNIYTNKGLLCRKKSARFIELFMEEVIEAPKPKRDWAKSLGLAGDPLYPPRTRKAKA